MADKECFRFYKKDIKLLSIKQFSLTKFIALQFRFRYLIGN